MGFQKSSRLGQIWVKHGFERGSDPNQRWVNWGKLEALFNKNSRIRNFYSVNTAVFMVGVSGFEPEASWTRTKRDTKLRHTPIAKLL